MIYDATLPEEVHHITGRSSRVSPWVQALMKIKGTRNEYLSRLFSRSHFIWHDSDVALDPSEANDRQDPFKRYALPFITTITIYLRSTASAVKSRLPPEQFDSLLRWMRWRSVRSRIHPWHVKHLKFVMPHILPRHQLSWRDMASVTVKQFYEYQSGFIHPHVLTRAHKISGLHSLDIVFPCYPKPEAAKKFFEQCASKGLVGKIGYQQQSGEKVSWLCIKNNQLLPQAH